MPLFAARPACMPARRPYGINVGASSHGCLIGRLNITGCVMRLSGRRGARPARISMAGSGRIGCAQHQRGLDRAAGACGGVWTAGVALFNIGVQLCGAALGPGAMMAAFQASNAGARDLKLGLGGISPTPTARDCIGVVPRA